MHKVSVVPLSKPSSQRLTLFSLEGRLYETAEAAQPFKVLFPPSSGSGWEEKPFLLPPLTLGFMEKLGVRTTSLRLFKELEKPRA